MLQLIMDYHSKEIFIPREIIDSIGATEDFGVLISEDGTRFVITRDNPLELILQGKRRGRPPKHRSNMQYWDASVNAFRIQVPALFRESRAEELGRCTVWGNRISDYAIIFDLPVHIDVSKYPVVSRRMFRAGTWETVKTS